MKTLRNAVLLLFAVPVFTLCSEEVAMSNAFASLQDILATLEHDALIYVNLGEEIEKMAQEFDTSAEIRRRLQCCITYTFDSLNQNASEREHELLALIAQKDETIAVLEERFELLKAHTATEIQELATVVDLLTQELNGYRQMRQEEDTSNVQQLNALVGKLHDVYATLQQERAYFLNQLEELANKAYGHFEIEAIESTVFGEHICGTLYCPDFDDQSIQVDLVDVQTIDQDEEAHQPLHGTADISNDAFICIDSVDGAILP